MDGRGDETVSGWSRALITLTHEQLKKVLTKALLVRRFEERVYQEVKRGRVKIPVYLAAGQEMTAATLSVIYEYLTIKPHIFIQHRGHSTYLSFGGAPKALAHELMGLPDGCAAGMGGSASIQSIEANVYGHDGLMGSHVPIAVGFAYEMRHPTICFVGDAAGEEDYSLTAIGWASTKNLPILFVIEDNNLSILTKKQVRRNWEISDVASSMKLPHVRYLSDSSPTEIANNFPVSIEVPALLNICTNRKFWHAGAGSDQPNYDEIDPLLRLIKELMQNEPAAWLKDQESMVADIVNEAWN